MNDIASAVWNRLNVDVLLTQVVSWIPSLFAAILIILAFWIFFRVTRKALQRVLARAGFDPALTTMLTGVYRFAVMTFALVMAASQLGINVGAALAGLGVVGLTIGFAAKDSLSNIMAGFLIFWDKPFRVGDWVSLGDHYGKIAEITMRTTRLRTRNNTWVIIPNESVINHILVNHSTNGETRLEVPVGIAYKEDIASARKVLLEAVGKLELIVKSPPPKVVVKALGSSSVDLIIHAWIANAEDEKPAFFQVMEAAKTSLDAAGIQIPFPHLQLFVDSVEDRVWEGASHLLANGRSRPQPLKEA